MSVQANTLCILFAVCVSVLSWENYKSIQLIITPHQPRLNGPKHSAYSNQFTIGSLTEVL